MFSLSSLVRVFRKPAMYVAAFALSAGSVSVLHADEIGSAPSHAAPAVQPGMTLEQIGQALDKYGKNTITTNGVTYYDLNIKRGDWNFKVFVELSHNGQIVYISAPLADIPDPSKASPVALANLLQKNSQLGTMFFELAGKNHKLDLDLPMPAAGLTPEMLQDAVEQMLATIEKTHELWRIETLLPDTAGTEPAPR